MYTNQFARVAKAAQARGQKLGEARGQKLGEALGLRRAHVETAKWKFGADVAERLADMLADVTDRSRLARMGRLLAECETGDELIAKAGGAAVREAGGGARQDADCASPGIPKPI